MSPQPGILGVGTANPPRAYTQAEVLQYFGTSNRRIQLLFGNSHIRTRHLVLPPRGADGTVLVESQGELLAKHRAYGLELGAAAITDCLKGIGADLSDIDLLCCVTSTGTLVPSLSALLIGELGLRNECARLDVVGMGCNAGLNGLNAAANWAGRNPGRLAVLACIEVCSAAYVYDEDISTAVVNSLFGDGAAAVALSTDHRGEGPVVLGHESLLLPDEAEAMRFLWSAEHGKYSFIVSPDVPYLIGANVEQVVDRLLRRSGLRRSQVSHWIVHGGGKKVVDSVKVNLGISTYDLRHTATVLRDFGNVSSGSFLFSYKQLRDEGSAEPGDYGVMVTMGPGLSIESCLIQWTGV